MKKIALLFRGENLRWCNDRLNNTCNCIPNNKERLVNSLRNMGYEVDIYFITYFSEYLHVYIEEYNPIKVFLMKYEGSSQHLNFKFLLDSIEPYVSLYEKILVFRFDLLYKKNISEWPMWNDKVGHMFPWRDVSFDIYNERKYCMDGFFSLDPVYFKDFKKLFDEKYLIWKEITYGIHFLTTILEEKKTIPFYFMENDRCYESNTSLSAEGHNNPYCINSLYNYYFDDKHLTIV